MISAVATILHSQMLEVSDFTISDQFLQDVGHGKVIPVKSELYLFSEEKYIKEKPEDFD